MVMKQATDSVYNSSYHLVWAPKYRKWVLRGEIRERVRGLFYEIGLHYGFEVMELRVGNDHVHVFINFPPKHSITKVVGILKAVSAREIREEFSEV